MLWFSYRLDSSSVCTLLLMLAAAAGAVNKTPPDSSNAILGGVEETLEDVIVNEEEIFPSSTDSRQDSPADSGSGDGVELFPFDNNNNTESTMTNSSTTTDWSQIWPYFNTGCLEWLPINHIYFQLANSFLFLSYLAPAGLYGLIYLRLMLAIGSAFFAIWGWIVLCAFDTFVWNAFFFLINVVHIIVLLFSLKPPKFDKQVEEVRIARMQTRCCWIDVVYGASHYQ